MHLVMLAIALVLAWYLRWRWSDPRGTWVSRWRVALGYFLVPPLLLVMTVVAILWMGPQGQMLGFEAGQLSYWAALGFLGYGGIIALKVGAQGWQSLEYAHRQPLADITGQASRILDVPALFAAQVGFWQPELVVSQGLLDTLNQEQIAAVLTHEQAHLYYRDTFWFFGLGWLRQLTLWLPNTQTLWQELLVLRELRADRWAAQQVDPLLLAESLLRVVSDPLTQPDLACAAFSAAVPRDRLTERIEALLAEPDPLPSPCLWSWSWLLLLLLPLLAVPLHG